MQNRLVYYCMTKLILRFNQRKAIAARKYIQNKQFPVLVL